MNYALPAEPNDAPQTTLRERCRALGLPVWRLDTSGVVIDDTNQPGLAGVWLRSSVMCRMLADAVRRWNAQETPDRLELFSGCHIVPCLETIRGRRRGYTAFMFLTPEALQAPEFDAVCAASQADRAAARSAVGRLATFTAAEIDRTAPVLDWMLNDLNRQHESERTIGGFTRHLTDAYEHIELLYALGNSMRDLQEPERFIRLAVEQLQQTTEFGWAAVRTLRGARLPDSIADSVFIAGEPGCDARAFREMIDAFAGTLPPDADAHIASSIAGRPLPCGAQVVVQPITGGSRRAAVLLTGDKGGDDPQVSSYDTQLIATASAFLGTFFENVSLWHEQNALFLGSLQAMTAAIDAKDRYTCGHSERVAHLATELSRLVGFDQHRAERVRITGLVHDVGKIGVPEAVLCKEGRLTDAEFALIRQHPVIGYDILKGIPQLEDVLPGVLSHHERWDGRGYPHGLKGESIPLVARIMALADTFDAMSSNRSYRPAMPRERVFEEIRRCAGTQFDPELAPLFLTLDFSVFDRLVAQHEAASRSVAATRAAA